MRKCTICQQLKREGEFKIVNGKLINQCKDCYAAYQRKWYQTNQETIRLRRNALYLSRRINALKQQANELGIKIHLKCDDEFEIKLEKQ